LFLFWFRHFGDLSL